MNERLLIYVAKHVWIYDLKTLEYDFCTCTPKLSNQNDILNLIKCSDWLFLFDYEYKTQQLYDRTAWYDIRKNYYKCVLK